MSDELKQQFKRHGLVALTILFDDAQTCEDFAQFGEVPPLEDVSGIKLCVALPHSAQVEVETDFLVLLKVKDGGGEAGVVIASVKRAWGRNGNERVDARF